MSDLPLPHSTATSRTSGPNGPDDRAVPAPLSRGPRRWRAFRAVGALVLREMTTTYGRSPGGYIWAILEPVAGVAVLTVFFSFIMRTPPLGTSFALFYATGMLCFRLYGNISNVTASAIQYSRPLLNYPALTYMDAMIARILLNLLTHLLVMVIVLGGIIVIWDLNVMINWMAVTAALGMVTIVGIGIGSMNCFLFVAFPVWRQIWGILTAPLFLLSGVIFIPENMPTAVREILLYSPIIHATSEMRKGFYPTYEAVHVVPLYPIGLGLVLTIMGLLLLLRYHKDILLR